VFSLRGWAPQIRTGFQGSRATREHHEGDLSPFVYRVVTFCDGPFHGLRLGADFVTPRTFPKQVHVGPTTPTWQRLRAITPRRFRLIPVRSPLLGESRLLSLPRPTEMFHFERFPPHALFYSDMGDWA
jgi:hypothetical protein